MTRQRSLKQHIRERMARTGETYSTARRHVLARVDRGDSDDHGARWPAAVPARYDTCGGGVHHDTALLHNALRGAGVSAPHTGQPWTEAMLVGLAGGIGFLYAVFEYQGFQPMVTIVARHHPEPYLPAALTRAGIPFALEQTGSVRKATVALGRVLDDGRTAICAVSRDALPWHADRGPLYSQDPYEVGVIGADDGTLYLDDEDPRPREIPAETFTAAWSAYRKGKHGLLTVTAPGQPIDLGAAVADAVATTCAHLTGPVLGHSFDVNFGFSGGAKLAAQLRDPAGKEGWSQRFADPEALSLALERLHDCLEIEYGGAGALRPIYADFLDEAAATLDRPEYGEAAALFRRSGAHWSAVATAAAERAEAADGADRAEAADGAEGVEAAEAAEAEGADPLSGSAVRALLDQLADGVAAALELERQAVEVLSRRAR